MKTAVQLIIVLVTAAVISGAALMFMSREERSLARASPPRRPVMATTAMPSSPTSLARPSHTAAPEPPAVAPVSSRGPGPSPAISPTNVPTASPVVAPPAPPNSAPQKDPIVDPTARVALFFVGSDPFAEEYWTLAINDPSLSSTERQDLIEDLNEDGISDPRHPVLEDLPLILARLDLIEALAQDALDEVNAAAFAEAYEDLLNLALLALGEGEPVR